MQKCIIIANGKAPSKGTVTALKFIGYSLLVCADGGADSARRLGLTPDYIIGDFDSIRPETLNYFRNKSNIIRIGRQNDTDVEKCLKFVIRKKYTEAVLLGGTGDRLDHSFCNIGIVIKFFDKIKVKIVSEKSILTPYSGNVELKTVKDETISLYGLNERTKITSQGLKYPLKKAKLPFGRKESTSNVATGETVGLKIKDGIIFVIRDFNLLRKYGLL
ncbi:MAG TPA: thiamine diphosphokinase [Ignavibacteriaceae bacterium]